MNMSKVKLNLTSGVSVEKPLINVFSANNTNYIILDNEMNGSMGLPIILVCKIVDNRVVKITDTNEWTTVKEYLKQIIAGNKLDNIVVPNEMAADDIYYTQLTLPIPSFDALKNAYTETKTEATQPQMSVDNDLPPDAVVPMMDSVAPVMDSPVIETPVVEPVAPVMPDPVMPQVESPIIEQPMPEVNAPVMDSPIVDSAVIEPQMPTFEMPTEPVSPVAPEIPMPEVNPEPVMQTMNTDVPTESIFSSQKEAFMEACENMFDALVQKFERQLQDNNKN